jgi:hypothetical protein
MMEGWNNFVCYLGVQVLELFLHVQCCFVLLAFGSNERYEYV